MREIVWSTETLNGRIIYVIITEAAIPFTEKWVATNWTLEIHTVGGEELLRETMDAEMSKKMIDSLGMTSPDEPDYWR